jgi:hypothetical protein
MAETKVLSNTIAYLKRLAAQEMHSENCEPYGFNAYDASGGNFDDAYAYGQHDGEVETARNILNMLGITF